MKARTARRIYLREAAIMLVVARLALRLLPPARVFAWAGRPPRRVRRFATDETAWVTWAVDDIGSRRWMNALCLPRALGARHAAAARHRQPAVPGCRAEERCGGRPRLGRGRPRQGDRGNGRRRLHAPRRVRRRQRLRRVALR